MRNFVQKGESLTITAAAAITAGDVVRAGQILGVAATDAAIGEEVELLFGVYTVPKVTAAVIAQGESLTWDASAAKFDDNLAVAASGDVTGAAAVAWEAAGNGVTELDVLLTGVPGALTA